MSPPRWAGLTEAAERTAREMKPQEVNNTLNALTKLDAAAAAMTPAGWAGLAQAGEKTARERNSKDLAKTLNALCKLGAAEAAVSPPGWAGLAEAVARTAREMNPQDVAYTLNAFTKIARRRGENVHSCQSRDAAGSQSATPGMYTTDGSQTPSGAKRWGWRTPFRWRYSDWKQHSLLRKRG